VQTGPAADDDASWLLADDLPQGAFQPIAPEYETARFRPLPTANLPAQSVPPTTEKRQATPADHLWLAIGEAFHPLPGRPLLVSAGTPQPAALVAAEPGSTVHAVLPGIAHRSGDGLELRIGDGRVVGYRGDAVVQWTVGDGQAVAAGAVLGWIGPTPDSAPSGSATTMVIYLVEADGRTVDPVQWLAGLVDPQELNLAGGLDPFRTDLRLSGLWDGSADGLQTRQ